MNILNATRVVLSVAAAVTVVYASPASAAAQDRQEMVALEWRETMEPGSRLFLHNMNGGITVGRATGNQAEVIVRKSLAAQRSRTGARGGSPHGWRSQRHHLRLLDGKRQLRRGELH